MPVAKRDLYIGVAKARNEGDLVSDEEVKRFGWEDYVESDTPVTETTTTVTNVTEA